MSRLLLYGHALMGKCVQKKPKIDRQRREHWPPPTACQQSHLCQAEAAIGPQHLGHLLPRERPVAVQVEHSKDHIQQVLVDHLPRRSKAGTRKRGC